MTKTNEYNTVYYTPDGGVVCCYSLGIRVDGAEKRKGATDIIA